MVGSLEGVAMGWCHQRKWPWDGVIRLREWPWGGVIRGSGHGRVITGSGQGWGH